MFCKKVVHIGNAKSCAEINAEVTHEAIDGLSSHRWTVGSDRWLEVQASQRTRGILTKCGTMEGWTVRAGKARSDQRYVPVPGVEEKLSMERREASMARTSIDGPCYWSIDWIREDEKMKAKEKVVWTDGGSWRSVVPSTDHLWGHRLKPHFLDKHSLYVFLLF